MRGEATTRESEGAHIFGKPLGKHVALVRQHGESLHRGDVKEHRLPRNPGADPGRLERRPVTSPKTASLE